MDGQLTTTNDKWILRFERDINHPVEKVWSALTENARQAPLAGWHSILDRLETAMNGSPIADSMDRWHELRAHYEEALRV